MNGKARHLAGLSVRDLLVTSAAGASPSKRAFAGFASVNLKKAELAECDHGAGEVDLGNRSC